MSPIHITGAATRRYPIVVFTAVSLIATAQAASAQAAAIQRRTRCPECATTPRDSLRARNDRLLLKFDSLRREFEHERLSDGERERLADEMHRVVMALEESMVEAHAQGMLATKPGSRVARELRLAPYMTSGPQNLYRTSGYLGVSFDGPHMDVMRRNERIIRFLEYPRIALVEPSSPAERAGIQAGDTLLAFNGNDVRDREISMSRLLVPSQRITVRVRRDGDPRDFRVTVDRAPEYVISRAVPMPPMPPMSAMGPDAPKAPIPGQVRVYGGDDLPRRSPVPAFVGPGAAGVGTIWIYSDGIAGAQVETITEGLGRAVGVKSGILVIRARPGTPAYRSGLRDGDVILRVSGKSVSTVRDLRGLLAESDGGDGVKLAIVRERKNREVVLRW